MLRLGEAPLSKSIDLLGLLKQPSCLAHTLLGVYKIQQQSACSSSGKDKEPNHLLNTFGEFTTEIRQQVFL